MVKPEERADLLSRIAHWRLMARHLLGPDKASQALEALVVSDRHKPEHLRRIREAWQQRSDVETAVAAVLAEMQARGHADGSTIRIGTRAVADMRAGQRGIDFLSGRAAFYERAEVADLHAKLLREWLASVPAEIRAWWDAAASELGDDE